MKPEKTRKPCPGCGYSWMRSADDLLCRQCKGYIESGKAAEAAAKSKGAELGDAGFIAMQVPAPDYDQMTGVQLLPQQMDLKTPQALEVIRALSRMLLALLPECEALPTVEDKRFRSINHRDIQQAPAFPISTNYSGRWPILYRLGTEAQRRAIMAFYDTLAPLTSAAHQHGIEYGRNLLLQMAAGEITAAELSNATTRGR